MQKKQIAALNDKNHLATVYQRHAPGLFAYLHRHNSSIEDTEDLVLEVFLAALERPDFEKLTIKEQEAWLWCVARNKMTDHYRKQLRRQRIPLERIPEHMYEQDLATPEVLLLQQEKYAHLQACIQQLPALQQEIVHMRFVFDLRSAEIAAILNKSESSVRVMLSRTLKLLRTIYENE